MAIPKRIHIFWLQGWGSAPPLARICADAWAAANPDHEVVLHDAGALASLSEALGHDVSRLPVQAVSDILRCHLLASEGGVWVDASVVPLSPLETWMAPAQDTGFFAFRGSRADRIVDSWLLAAAPGEPLIEGWWQAVRRYWEPAPKPLFAPPPLLRGPMRSPLRQVRWMTKLGLLQPPANPVEYVSRDGQARWRHLFPYFWFHYLFADLLLTRPDLNRRWLSAFTLPSEPPHAVAWRMKAQPDAPLESLVAAAEGSVVQKLRFKRSLPAARLVEVARALTG